MLPIEEVEELLDEIAMELPEAIYNELNGGIILLPETKRNPIGRDDDLYIMGEYNHGGAMGRYICIYYGSFMEVYGHLSRESLKKRLADTLKHEFTHHLESLAGERDLEIEDERYINNYLERYDRKRVK